MNAPSFSWLLLVVAKLISSIDANWINGNLCWSMPCTNGGSCYGSAYTYLCVCPTDFTGAFCEKQLGICQENPCGNRGSCIERSLTSFECRCYFDYVGLTCERRLQRHNKQIWSSLNPAHTRALFEMFQQAYRDKAHGRSFLTSNSDKIDFLGLLTTVETSSSSKATTLEPTTQSENTYLETITSDASTEAVEETTNTATDYPSSDEYDITLGIIEGTETTSESGLATSDASVEMISSTEQLTTLPISTPQPSTTVITTTTKAPENLCKEVLAHILPEAPAVKPSSSTNDKATNALLIWLRQHLRASHMSSSTLHGELTTASQLSTINDDLDEVTAEANTE